MSVSGERVAGVALLCDVDGRVLEVVRRDPGAPDVARPGARLADLVDASSAARAERFLRALREQRATFGWELAFPGPDGPVTLHVAGSAVEDGLLVICAASRAGVAGLYDDLSRINNQQANALRSLWKESTLRERERAEADQSLYEELSRLNNELATSQRELAKSNASLARLNEQKNRFLGMAAHDIRNPLDVILTYSGFLLDDAGPALEPEQVEFLRLIRSSSGFLLGLVDDLLDISKIEAGRLDLDRSPVDVAALVARNVELNRVIAERKRVELRLDAEAGAPKLWLDPQKIEQVLNNLVGNAIKYSPEGSVVDVRVATEGEALAVSVTNPGSGIAASDLPAIFDPFVTATRRGTAGEKSTGLGLAIAKRVVEGHGGAVRAESSPGGDTTFTFTIPLRAAAGSTTNGS